MNTQVSRPTRRDARWIEVELETTVSLPGHRVLPQNLSPRLDGLNWIETTSRDRDLFSLARAESVDEGVFFAEEDGGDAGEHLAEVLLQTADVLAVADDLEQILVPHEVETAIESTVNRNVPDNPPQTVSGAL